MRGEFPALEGGLVPVCMYTAKPGGSIASLSVSDTHPEDVEAFMRVKGGAGAADTTESISGIGERNLFLVRPSDRNSFTVFYHGKQLVLGVTRHMTPELKAAMIQQMKEMLARI